MNGLIAYVQVAAQLTDAADGWAAVDDIIVALREKLMKRGSYNLLRAAQEAQREINDACQCGYLIENGGMYRITNLGMGKYIRWKLNPETKRGRHEL